MIKKQKVSFFIYKNKRNFLWK